MIVLKREPGGMPEYLTLHDDFTAASMIAWVSDPARAFGFARDEDAELFKKRFSRFLGNGVIQVGSVK